jgi:glycolate oxidase FAD binding subunit
MDALEQIIERVQQARADKRPLAIRGGGSKDWYGSAAPQGEVLDVSGHRGIVDYEPSELVITARCGTPLSEIEATVAAQRQMLAFEPPRYGAASTIGGIIAAGLSGPRRATAGAARDFVLGTRLLDGHGRHLRFGGTVMKNVAGYDVSRLLAGSLGVLGVISEVSLKVLPLPQAEATLCFELDQATALNKLNTWGGQPLPLSGSTWLDGILHLRLSGAAAAVASACAKLGGKRMDDATAAAFWASLRDQTHHFFASNAPLWRLSVAATAAPIDGTALVEWGGAQRWLRGNADAAALRTAAHSAGGHATLFRHPTDDTPRFTPLAPALAAIHRRLKAEFDPQGIFNPQRLTPEF